MKQFRCVVFFVVIISVFSSAKQWYVSTAGQLGNDGSELKPFATILEARNAIRDFRKQNVGTKEPHVVIIEDGSYHIEQTIQFDPQDSGSLEAPVIYRARNIGKVSLSTAPILDTTQFRKPTTKEQSYLKDIARADVLVMDVSDELAEKFGPGQADYGVLSWNEHVLQLAQWPNRGYMHMDKVHNCGPAWRWLEAGMDPLPYSYEEPIGGKFTMKEQADWTAWNRELERTWEIEQDGHLNVDWTQESNTVARISDKGLFQLLDSSRYGVGVTSHKERKTVPDYAKPKTPDKKHRRLVFRNILCELDMPGEWYFDRQENKLYLWPINDKMDEATIAVASGPMMLTLNDTKHISFEGIVFENGGDDVMKVTGEYNKFAGFTFRNLKGRVGVVSGMNTGFQSCDFYNMDTCIIFGGGVVKDIDHRNDYKVECQNIRTLEKSNNYLENCIFHDFRGYEYGAISLIGCGISFNNNMVYRINSGIWYSGMYIEFQNNEFFEVGIGMGDWNIVYQGGNFWCNGNRVENNFFHHMFQTPSFYGVIAARNDDGGSGTTYNKNIFYKTGCGAVVSMGPSCHVTNNIVIDTTTVWRTNKRPITEEDVEAEYQQIRDNFESGKYPRGAKEDRVYNVELAVGKEGWNKEPFKSVFPDFPKYMSENPFAQSYSSVMNNYSNFVDEDDPYNVVYIHGSFQLADNDGMLTQSDKMDVAFPKSFKYNAPRKITKHAFVDYKCLDLRLKPDFETMPGFEPCDMDVVGLYQDTYRPVIPDKRVYRRKLYEKHKFHIADPRGLSYDEKNAYKMYPVQSWMPEDESEYSTYPYLSGIETERYLSHVELRRDVDYRGGKITLGGKQYVHGIMAIPESKTHRSEMLFDLKPYLKASSLYAVIGIEDSIRSGGEALFTVEGLKDGRWIELYKSPVLNASDDGLPINVDIQGCRMLMLKTVNSDNKYGSHTVWADAQFVE